MVLLTKDAKQGIEKLVEERGHFIEGQGVEVILNAAKFINEKFGYQCITYETLRLLTGIDPKGYTSYFKNTYGKKRDQILQNYHLNVPYIEFLRHEIGSVDLPFVSERQHWKKFEPSKEDWLRDVKIPKPPFDRTTSQTLGMIYGAGSNIVRAGNRDYEMYYFHIYAKEEEFDFFSTIVVPRLENLFNLDISFTKQHRDSIFNSKKISFDYYELFLNSKAIISWLTDDLEFTNNKEKLPLNKCNPEGLLEGIISMSGCKFYDDLSTRYLRLIKNQKEFIKTVYKLAKSLGYTPHEVTKVVRTCFNVMPNAGPSWMTALPETNLKNLTLLNPRHQLA